MVRARHNDDGACMSFHLGRPIFVMTVLALLCGAGLALRSGEKKRADLLMWVFDEQHRRIFEGNASSGGASLIDRFEKETGKTVGIELVSTRAEDIRLVSMFMSDSRDVPDLVEIEIGSVVKYFRPPVRDVGLLPLNGFLKQSGWMDQIVKARFAPWSKDGVIFGVPYDVHPVALVYRQDLFEEAGIDLSAMKTWPAFRSACVAFQEYWKAHGASNRHAMELQKSSADHLLPMLLQRHLNPINGEGKIEITQEKFVKTVAFYIECVAGPMNIATQPPSAAGALRSDLLNGNICVLMTPDYRVDQLKELAPELAGKLHMMPMPVFEPGDAPTATWGGTMIGIPRNAKDPQAAWKLIELLYLSKQGAEARQHYTSILPPVMSQWNDPAYQRGDPYFSGQKIDRLYIELARKLPSRYVSPATSLASGYLSRVILQGCDFVQDHPGDHAALVARCRAMLVDIRDDLQRRIQHGKFDE
jgi:ABC-type glycerol-3-phosphate transport system substrate-binding protein